MAGRQQPDIICRGDPMRGSLPLAGYVNYGRAPALGPDLKLIMLGGTGQVAELEMIHP